LALHALARACRSLIRKLITVIAPSVATAAVATAAVATSTVATATVAATTVAASGVTAVTVGEIAATAPSATVNTARRRRRRGSIDLAAGRGRRSIDLAAGRRRRRSIDLAAGRRRRRRRRSAATGAIRDGTMGEWEVSGSGVGRNHSGSDRESSGGYDSDPAEFQHHDTSPVIHFVWR